MGWERHGLTESEHATTDHTGIPGVGGGGGGGGSVPAWMERLATRLDAVHTDDDEFADDSIAAAWTAVTPTGNVTWTEGAGLLSVIADLQSANDICCQLRSMTTTTAPITIETVFKDITQDASFHMNGLVFSDGTAPASNAVMFAFYNGTGGTNSQLWSGTLTNMNSQVSGNVVSPPDRGWHALGLMYMRLVWSAANTWKLQLSPDGVTWSDFGLAAQTATLTPTHYGVFATTWGSSEELITSFEYFRVYETDKAA